MRDNKLEILMLIAIGLGAIIATGAYDIPAAMAIVASPFATIIAWVITFIGVFALAVVFKILSDKRPDIKGGQLGYAKEGFGNFAGGLIGWGYYVCVLFVIIACLIATSEVLVYFINVFAGNDDNMGIAKFVITTISIWIIYNLLCLGASEVGIASIILSICKIIPIVLFIVIIFQGFDKEQFNYDFYGRLRTNEIGGIYKQVEGLATINLWCLIGFETIGIVSVRAKNMRDVGNATTIAVVISLVLYLLISIGSLGILTSEELSLLEYPSAAFVLGTIIGNKGEIMMHFGILIAAASALIAWSFAAVELLQNASKEGLFFVEFSKEEKGIPKRAALLVCTTLQMLVIITYFSPRAYSAVYTVATSSAIIPYFVSVMFAMKVVKSEKSYEKQSDRIGAMIIVAIAAIYLLWLVYATLLDNVLYIIIVYSIGVIIYMVNMKRAKRKIFDKVTGIIAASILVATVLGILFMYYGLV